jgi:hypothetical protein
MRSDRKHFSKSFQGKSNWCIGNNFTISLFKFNLLSSTLCPNSWKSVIDEKGGHWNVLCGNIFTNIFPLFAFNKEIYFVFFFLKKFSLLQNKSLNCGEEKGMRWKQSSDVVKFWGWKKFHNLLSCIQSFSKLENLPKTNVTFPTKTFQKKRTIQIVE